RARHPRATPIRHDPRMSLLRPTDARAAWSVTAGGEDSARATSVPGGHASLAIRPSLRHLRRVTRATWPPGSAAPSRRKGCTRPGSQSLLAPPAPRGNQRWAMRSSYRRCARRRGAGIIAALAPLRRPPTRQSVAPLPEDAAAKFFLVRGLHNLFLLS